MVTTRIDLAHLDNKTTQLLHDLLQQKAKNGTRFFSKENYHIVESFDPGSLQIKKTKVTLSHSIIQRPRNKLPNVDRYEIINHDDLVGEGGFSRVYGVLATIALDNGTLQFKQNKSRVVKVQTCTTKEIHDILNEVNITRHAGSMHIKQPSFVIVDYDQYDCYMVMHRLKGSDLYSILEQMYKTVLTLTTQQRLTIAINLLTQLIELHNKGIVHRDIKPDNVMLDLNTGEMVIFDFGLSKLSDTKDDSTVQGSLGFIPEEVYLNKGTTFKSDVFSMSIIIAMLFYADKPEGAVDHFISYPFNNIFNDKTINLNEDEKKRLLDLLKKMSRQESSHRCTAKEALQSLIDLREDYVNREIDLMIANRPPRYLFAKGLFVNNIIKEKTDDEKPVKVHSSKF